MVRIRLRRMGKKKDPTYRIVVADVRSPRDGKFIEIIGNYAPTRQPKTLNIDGARARYWLSVGAQPSDTVEYLLKKAGVLATDGSVLPQQPLASPEESASPASPEDSVSPASQEDSVSPASPTADGA